METIRIADPIAPEIWKQADGSLLAACEHICRCASVCYGSQPRYGEEAIDFVIWLYEKGHGRPLEFGWVYTVDEMREGDTRCTEEDPKWGHANYVTEESGKRFIYRSWNLREALNTFNGRSEGHKYPDTDRWFKFLEGFFTEPVFGMHAQPITIHFPLLSRGIADEFRTHTALSGLMRSTRYVDMNKSGRIAFVKPEWYGKDGSEGIDDIFRKQCAEAAKSYRLLLERTKSKQSAREVLPLSIGTEIVLCGLPWAWEHMLRLRTDKAAHPDMRAMAKRVENLYWTGTTE